jgi:hypothetical protein
MAYRFKGGMGPTYRKPPRPHRPPTFKGKGLPTGTKGMTPPSGLIQPAPPVPQVGNPGSKGGPAAPGSNPGPITPYSQADLQKEFSQGVINPGDAMKLSSYTPSAGQPDPRDATYWDNVNKLMFQAQQGYGQGLQQQAYSDINWGATQQNEETQRQRNERQLAESMISRGLVTSGYHNTGQAQAAQDFTSRMGELTRSKTQEDAARNAAQMAILQGFSIDEAAALAEAVARQAGNLADEADTGMPDLADGGIGGPGAGGGKGGKGRGGGGKGGKGGPKKRKKPPGIAFKGGTQASGLQRKRRK